MLEAIMESSLKEKVLFFLLANDDAYPREIAANFGFNLNAVQYQLRKLEKAGVLRSRLRGKVRLYGLDPAYPFRKEFDALLKRAFALLKASEKEKLYKKRQSGNWYENIIPKASRPLKANSKPEKIEETEKKEPPGGYYRKAEPLDFSVD
jgi:predicted transcriptional regulator